MKRCPYCAEEIQDAAILCRYCRSDLRSSEKVVGPPADARRPAPSTEKAQGSSLEEPEARIEHPGPHYLPLHGLGRVAAYALFLGWTTGLLSLILLGLSSSPNASRNLAGVAVACLYAALLVNAVFLVAFLWWQYRAHTNLLALGVRDLRFSPVAAVVGWLVPVVNLFIGYAVMADLQRASDPSTPQWKREPSSTSVQAWITSILLSLVSLGLIAAYPPLAVQLFYFGVVFSLCAAIALWAMMDGIAERQSQWAQSERSDS